MNTKFNAVEVNYNYNRLFFSEHSLADAGCENRAFWSAISALQRQNPNDLITVTISLKENLGNYYEVLSIACGRIDIEKKAWDLHLSLYHHYPIFLKPEFDGRDGLDFCH